MKKFSVSTNLFLALATLSFTACGGNTPTVEAINNTVNPIVNPNGSTDGDTHSATPDAEKPLALIYKGLGSCSLDQGDAGDSGYGCSEASADAAVAAGFRYQYVGPNDLNNNSSLADVAAVFGKAKVWIQPGGISNVAYNTMSTKLKSSLIKFVNDGGGYVGFCAGAFLATNWFNIFPGNSHLYGYSSARSDVGYAFLSTTWNGKARKVYFEGGPYLSNLSVAAEVTATFTSGYVAAARAVYGKGRVYISGPHPEAPPIWSEEDGIKDPDGSDLDLAADMITWSANL